MKSLKNYILESQIKYPYVLFMDEDGTDNQQEASFIDWLDEMLEKGESIIVYEGPKSSSAKRNTGLEFNEASFDTEYFASQCLRKSNQYGFEATLEDEYTVGVSFMISGPLPTTKYYVRICKLDCEDAEKTEPKFPNDFVKFDTKMLGF